MKTIIEPFRIKMTEAMTITDREYRMKQLEIAHYNMFLLDSQDVTIDLLSDSGTGAMSTKQWAAMMLGDESYAGSTSWHHFQRTVREITGFKHIFPTHQGRAPNVYSLLLVSSKTTLCLATAISIQRRANIEYVVALAEDLLTPDGEDLYLEKKFKGNIDLTKLNHIIKTNKVGQIPFCMLTVTNNAGGGQPVSMENIEEVKKLLQHHKIPLIIDSAATLKMHIHQRI